LFLTASQHARLYSDRPIYRETYSSILHIYVSVGYVCIMFDFNKKANDLG